MTNRNVRNTASEAPGLIDGSTESERDNITKQKRTHRRSLNCWKIIKINSITDVSTLTTCLEKFNSWTAILGKSGLPRHVIDSPI